MTRYGVRTVVIPAAGLGTRLLPVTKSVPKELLPVAGRPLLQFAVEEAAASGVETVVLVLSRGKEALATHFARDLALENKLAAEGREESAEALRRLAQLAEIRTVWQTSQIGLADAVRCARPVVDGKTFAVLLPDALFDCRVPALAQLLTCYRTHHNCVVGTQLIADVDAPRFGVLEVAPVKTSTGRTLRVKSLEERPTRRLVGPQYGIFGRYILVPEIFDCIERISSGLSGELQLTDALALLAETSPLYARSIEGKHFDAGSPLGLLEANLAFAMKDPQLAGPLRSQLKSLTDEAALHGRE